MSPDSEFVVVIRGFAYAIGPSLVLWTLILLAVRAAW